MTNVGDLSDDIFLVEIFGIGANRERRGGARHLTMQLIIILFYANNITKT